MTGESASAKWVAPLVAVGTFFAIAGSIGIALWFYFRGDFLQRDPQPERGPLVVQCRDDGDRLLTAAWVIVTSSTDRRVLDRYQKTVGQTAILRADAVGRVTIPAAINRHGNLDMLCWAPGYRAAAFRRFQRGSANKVDMIVERGGSDPSRPLPPGTVAELRLAPEPDGTPSRDRMRRRLHTLEPRRFHATSATVGELEAALATP